MTKEAIKRQLSRMQFELEVMEAELKELANKMCSEYRGFAKKLRYRAEDIADIRKEISENIRFTL